MSPLFSAANLRPRLPPVSSQGVSGSSAGSSSQSSDFSCPPQHPSHPASLGKQPPPAYYALSARSPVKPPSVPSFPASGAVRVAPATSSSFPSEAASPPSRRNSSSDGMQPNAPVTNGVSSGPSQTRVGRDSSRRNEAQNGKGPGPRVPPLQLQTRVSSLPPPSSAVRLNAKIHQREQTENGTYVAAAAWMRATEAARLLLGESKGGNSGVPTPAAAGRSGSPKTQSFSRAGKRSGMTPFGDFDGAVGPGANDEKTMELEAELKELRGKLAEQERQAADRVRELEKRERELFGRVQELEEQSALQAQVRDGFSELLDAQQQLQQLQREHRQLQQREQELVEKESELQRQLEQHQRELQQLHQEVKELQRHRAAEMRTNGVVEASLHEAEEQRAQVQQLERKVRDLEKLHRDATERDAMRIRALEEENKLLKRTSGAAASNPSSGGRQPLSDSSFQLHSLQQLQAKLQGLKQRHLQALEAAESQRHSEAVEGNETKPTDGETGDQASASAVFDDFDLLLQKLAAAQEPEASGSGVHALGALWGGASRRRSLSRCSSASRLAAPPLPPGSGDNTANAAGVALSTVSGHAATTGSLFLPGGGRLLPPTPSACSSVISDSVARSSVGRRLMSTGVIAAAVQQVQQAVAKSMETDALARQKVADLRNFHRKSFSELTTRLAGTVAMANSLAGSRGATSATPSQLSVPSNAHKVPEASEIPSCSSTSMTSTSSILPSAVASVAGPSPAVHAYPTALTTPVHESSSGLRSQFHADAGTLGVDQGTSPSSLLASPFMQSPPVADLSSSPAGEASAGPPRPTSVFSVNVDAVNAGDSVPVVESQDRGNGDLAPSVVDSSSAHENETVKPENRSEMVTRVAADGELDPVSTGAGSFSPGATLDSGSAIAPPSAAFPCAVTPPCGISLPPPVSCASPASVPMKRPFEVPRQLAGPFSTVSRLSGANGQTREPGRDFFGVTRGVVPSVSAHAVRSTQAIPAFVSPPPMRPEVPTGPLISAASPGDAGECPRDNGERQENLPPVSGVMDLANGTDSAPVEVGLESWHASHHQGKLLNGLDGPSGGSGDGFSKEGLKPLHAATVPGGGCQMLPPMSSSGGKQPDNVDCGVPSSVPCAGQAENGGSEHTPLRMEGNTRACSQTALPVAVSPPNGVLHPHVSQAHGQTFPDSLQDSKCRNGFASAVPKPQPSQSLPTLQLSVRPPGPFGVGPETLGVTNKQQIGTADDIGAEGKGFWDEDDLDEWNIDDVPVQPRFDRDGPLQVPQQAPSSQSTSSQLPVSQPSLDSSSASPQAADSFSIGQMHSKDSEKICGLGSIVARSGQGLPAGMWQVSTQHQQPPEGSHESLVVMPSAQQRPASAGHRPIEDLFS
ncbi:hypothetical protein TGVEG_207370 [Toxoplasma gondii VEG]|uniref:Uncharacterized protein n=1 Tax=Toxoplasma gondii (strain ATCC 50861 / VEG) TaxID=432359 RepID=V4ZAA1_TOXGV|nr:hypothetical protein TGVEG_207370 [Toxoplasma gondii VEG]